MHLVGLFHVCVSRRTVPRMQSNAKLMQPISLLFSCTSEIYKFTMHIVCSHLTTSRKDMSSTKFHRIENCRNTSRITSYLWKLSHSCILNLYLEMSVTISSVIKMYVFVKGLRTKI